jgi:pyruvate dehydrogenase E1 component
MDALFKVAGIYSPDGQRYTPVDAGTLLPYKEAADGQILQEGICETGAMASFLAAGTAYAMHGVPTIPFYFFYSIFGFQRVGDMIWACGDSLCRGFLIGGTAGRTTLNGEGLQHQDGHSPLVAQTVPNLVTYDPAFAFELALIVRDGIRRMYERQEDVFYYLTVYNENYRMPVMPPGVEDGVLRGLYCYARSAGAAPSSPVINLLASGSLMQQALAACDLLRARGFAVNVWSMTSAGELYRDALACERWNRLHPLEAPRVPYVDATLREAGGVFVAVSDYMKALGDLLSRWVPGPYTTLGTDGYGLSESRAALRAHFEVGAADIALAALDLLKRAGSRSS